MTICRISQPASILQWQLTENYSLLTGGAEGSPLEPTQRFWNLKQLNMTPPGSTGLGIKCDKPGVAVCAYADTAPRTYTLHLVNNGAEEVGEYLRFAGRLKATADFRDRCFACDEGNAGG